MIRLSTGEGLGIGLVSPLVPRLAEPELRARTSGYLAAAPLVGAGERSDGVWVWPEALAESVIDRGVGPERELLDHVLAQSNDRRDTLPSTVLASTVLAEIERAVQAGRPVATAASGHFFAVRGAAGQISHVVHRVGDLDTVLTPVGCLATTSATRTEVVRGMDEVSPARAARLLDVMCEARHAQLLRDGAEGPLARPAPRLARVFDRDASPWFSADRLRLADLGQRSRVLDYLRAGRLVVRATGRAQDPFAENGPAVIPLGFVTDGEWVWQEALTHYVETRGVAPELALLCHIERRVGQAPTDVSDDVAREAVRVATAGPPPWPARPSRTYFLDRTTATLVRADGPDRFGAEILDVDLRWRPTRVVWRGSDSEYEVITEQEAARLIDERVLADRGAR